MSTTYDYSDFAESTLVNHEQIQSAIVTVSEEIRAHYANLVTEEEPLVLVCVLKGSFVFSADLARGLRDAGVPNTMEFICVSNYGSATKSTGEVRMLLDLRVSIRNRHVLFVEDIIDSGRTLDYLIRVYKTRSPASVKSITLLDKPEGREVDLKPDFNCFKIPHKFVVGYGLDFEEMFRDLRDVIVLKKSVYAPDAKDCGTEKKQTEKKQAKKADKKHVDPAPAPAPVALKNPTATPLIANFKKFAGDVSAYFMFINLEYTNDVCNFICGPEGFSPEEILTMLTNPKECTKLQDAYVKIAKTSAKKEEKTREEIAKLVADFMDKKVGGVKTLKEAEEKAKKDVDPATAELIADFAAFVATKTQKHTTPKMFALVMDYLPEGFHPADIKTMLTNGEDCDELLETYVRLAVVPSADKLRVRNELVAFVEDYAESKGIVQQEMCW